MYIHGEIKTKTHETTWKKNPFNGYNHGMEYSETCMRLFVGF